MSIYSDVLTPDRCETECLHPEHVAPLLGRVIGQSKADQVADAGHMLTDVSGIGLSLLAIWFGARPASPRRSFGSYRLEILAAMGNAMLLFGVSGLILFGSVNRLFHPNDVGTGLMLAFAI